MATVMIRVDQSVRDAADVVAHAVKAAQRKAFWEAVDESFARMSPEELASYHAEREEWNNTLKDGLDRW